MSVSTTAPPAPRESTSVRPSRRYRFRAWLATPTAWHVACGLLAALPLLGVVIGMAQLHWAPTADDGTIAWRGWLVFSRHPPLVGQFTLASHGQSTYDPGPLLYWVAAVPARIWTDLGPMVGVCILGAASVVVAVVAAGQVGGRAVAAVVAGASLIGVWAASYVLGQMVWNPYSAMLPFVGLLLVTWAVATGRLGWWPVAVFLGSYCLQAHLVYGAASVLLVVAGPVLGYVTLRRSGASSRLGKRWWVGGLVVGAIVWAAPVWQQIKHKPGNVAALWHSTFNDPARHVGSGAGLRLLGWSIRVPPMWSAGDRRSTSRVPAMATHGTATEVWAVVALVLLFVAALVAFRRRLHDVFGIAVVALLASIGAVASIRGMAIDKSFATLSYVNAIFYPIGFIVWFALGWSAWRLLIQPWLTRRETTRGFGKAIQQRRATVAAVSLVLLLGASIGVAGWISHAAPHAYDSEQYSWRHLNSINKQALHLVERGNVPKGRLALQVGGLGTGSVETMGIAYQLLTHGWIPTVNSVVNTAVDDLRFRSQPTDAELIVGRPGSPTPARARRLGALFDPGLGGDLPVYFRPASG